jgi:ubiquinone/menaquinone biosynthesis C-methylase UbiE
MAADELPQLARPVEFARLLGYSVGFYGVWLIHVGRETGLLEKIATGPMSTSRLISATKMHPPAVRAWCTAAVSYGLASERKGKLHLKPEMRSLLLDRKTPDYLGGQFSYLALRSLEYGALGELFKSGRTRGMSTFKAVEQATDWDHYAFLAAIKRDKKLHKELSKGCKVLDVGCGTGSLLTKMKSAYPRSSFVGIDPSKKAVAIANRAATRSVKIMKQSGESMAFDCEFDLVYLGESLYAAKNKQKMISNCHRALKPGGTTAIVEGLLPGSNLHNDENRLIMGMQLDFALQGYSFMTRKEIAELLRMFSGVQFKDLGGSVYLVTGRR